MVITDDTEGFDVRLEVSAKKLFCQHDHNVCVDVMFEGDVYIQSHHNNKVQVNYYCIVLCGWGSRPKGYHYIITKLIFSPLFKYNYFLISMAMGTAQDQCRTEELCPSKVILLHVFQSYYDMQLSESTSRFF